MICKAAEYKNGYIFTPTSNDDDFQEILRAYKDDFHCIICNENTKRNFKSSVTNLVINKKIADGCFFVNGVY